MAVALQTSTTRSVSTPPANRTDQTAIPMPAGQDTCTAPGRRSAAASTNAKDDRVNSIIDPLVPSWEPARGMGRTAVYLAELLICLVLLVLIGNILHRAGYFLFEFCCRGKWREAPRDLKISLGKEGVIVEALQEARIAKAPLHAKLIDDLAVRVDNLEGGLDTLVQTMNGLIRVEAEHVLDVAAKPDTPDVEGEDHDDH